MFTGNLCAPSKVSMSKCILIADDNPGVRLLIRTFLRIQTKYDVCGEAVDGVDAIEKARALKPDPRGSRPGDASDERSASCI